MSWWWWHDQPFWEHFPHGFRDARIESASQNPCWNIIHQDFCATKPPLEVLPNRHPCTLYSGIHYGSTSGPNYQNLRRFLVSKNLKNKYEWNKNGPWKYEWNINEPWKKSKLTSNMQKRAAFSLERGGGSTETYTRKFENLKTQRCGEGAPWGNEGKRGPFLFRVFQKIIAWYI